MGFTLDEVVPWGRSYNEYRGMFDLSGSDLQRRILGCSDGPAAFNRTLTKRGGEIISFDPLYHFSVDAVRRRVDETFEEVMAQVRENRDEFLWTTIDTPERLGQIRMAAMEDFLSDFQAGKKQGRYVAGELPELPFADEIFGLALCSHFLFLYSEQLSEEFHLASIRSLCRVADEVRIFPLVELGSRPSRHLQSILARLDEEGFISEVVKVPYEFQRGGDQMLTIRKKK